jgi:nicotinamide-nucleotide amidase
MLPWCVVDAIILSVGTELVSGQCVDTNSAWLAARLAERGVATIEHQTIGDDVERLAAAIRRAIDAAEVVIITGGLGPTLDDITRDALAAALEVPLQEKVEALRQIEAFFQRLGRTMTESNRRQALIPRGCEMIPNPRGTAPGIHWQGRSEPRPLGSGEAEAPTDHPPVSPLGKGGGIAPTGYPDATWTARLWALPGVPSEMKAMFESAIAPALMTPGPALMTPTGGRSIKLRRLHCFGITEAKLGEQIADLMARGRNPNVGTTASGAVLTVRILAAAETPAAAEELAGADAAEVRRRLGEVVFGEEEGTLQSTVAALLIVQHKTIATAESCTGGLLAERLTQIPGGSAYFLRGFVTYSDRSKCDELGVPPELIARHGAVSEPVAEALASGCRTIARSDYALSITGIAGPTGGSAEKPVGLVYIGLADPDARVEVKRLSFGDHLSRNEIRDRAVKAALNLLRLRLRARAPSTVAAARGPS